MEFLDGMMKGYLHQSDSSTEDDNLSAKNAAPERIIIQQQAIDSNDYKKRRIHDNQETMIELRNKYTSTYIQEVQYIPTSNTNSDYEFLHPLWSMEPRIFAMETSTSGKRKYIVCNLGRFMNHYWRKSDMYNRHYYELIREDTPCRLYFGTHEISLDLDRSAYMHTHLTHPFPHFMNDINCRFGIFQSIQSRNH